MKNSLPRYSRKEPERLNGLHTAKGQGSNSPKDAGNNEPSPLHGRVHVPFIHHIGGMEI